MVSLVRNNHHSSIQKALGFLTDSRRMNVLLSRAKWQLILITSKEFLTEVIAAAKGGEDEQRIGFLRKMLEGLAAGEKAGTVASIPYERLMKEPA
jgi:superfamily I DNA and/or RNA helicase